MKKFLRILKYVTPYWKYAVLNVVSNLLSIIFSLVSFTMIIPFLSLLFGKTQLVTQSVPLTLSAQSVIQNFYYIISLLIINHGKEQALVFICIIVVVFILLRNVFRYLAMYYMAPIRNGALKDIWNDIYLKVLHLPLAYFTEKKKGDLLARATNDVHVIEISIMNSLELLFRDPLNIIIFLITLFVISPSLTLMVLLMLPLTGLLIGRIASQLRKQSGLVQKKMGNILSIFEETISSLRIIKAFNASEVAFDKFTKFNQSYNRLMTSIYRKGDLSSPLSEFLGVVVMVVIMWFGGKLVLSSSHSLDPSVFIAYIAIFSQLITPAKSFTTAYYNVQRGIASADRIMEILDADEQIFEKQNPKSIKDFKQTIEFKNVDFSYNNNDKILNNINLTVPKGKTIALVGPSGSGKTSLVNLLPRFYDCTGGDILIDGISILDLGIISLRDLMGIVTQETILFNDTISNNIAFGMKNVTEEQIIHAAKIANAHEFIMNMDNGYLSYVGDRGGKLSGGQKQRISIARAVLKNPQILILDEATSALDTESEKLVQDAIIKLMENRTSFVISHRLSTIQYADEIIVLNEGKIIEQGKHAELLAINGMYKKLYDMQAFN